MGGKEEGEKKKLDRKGRRKNGRERGRGKK